MASTPTAAGQVADERAEVGRARRRSASPAKPASSSSHAPSVCASGAVVRPGWPARRTAPRACDAEAAQVAGVAGAEPLAGGGAVAPTTTTTSGRTASSGGDRLGAGPPERGRVAASGRPSTAGSSSGGAGQKATTAARGHRPAALREGGHGSSVPDATWDTAAACRARTTPATGRSRPLRRLRRPRTRSSAEEVTQPLPPEPAPDGRSGRAGHRPTDRLRPVRGARGRAESPRRCREPPAVTESPDGADEPRPCRRAPADRRAAAVTDEPRPCRGCDPRCRHAGGTHAG